MWSVRFAEANQKNQTSKEMIFTKAPSYFSPSTNV